MDFLGFHPLYVVILLALALIIFGPSRLPKMGAQMGRMLREFQAARDGLTQQMREAFEEEPNSNFATSTATVEEEPEPASEGSAVAVLDPPPGGQNSPEALGTAVDGASNGAVGGASDGPWEGFSPVAEDATAEVPEAATSPHSLDTVGAVEVSPAGSVEEPDAAAAVTTPAEPVAPAEPAEAEVKAEAADVPGSDSVAPPITADASREAASTDAANPFAWVEGDHQTTAQPHDEGARRD